MAHDSSDRPGWDDPATSPFEVGAGGEHPLFVSGSERPLESAPSTPHRLALPMIDGAGIRSVR